MIRVALKGLLGRKLRAFLTAFAIVLGVATVSGTYVLTDSISDAFDNIFTGVYRGTDAVVTESPPSTCPTTAASPCRRSTSRCSRRFARFRSVAPPSAGSAARRS